jgi:hypothetical protein
VSYGNPELDRAVAVAGSLTTRPDGRSFCRLSAATSLREVTPRVAQALRLAQKAAPHLQRQTLLVRKRELARALGAAEAGSRTQRAEMAAQSAIQEALQVELARIQEDLRLHPPTEAERQCLEAAAFGFPGAPQPDYPS